MVEERLKLCDVCVHSRLIVSENGFHFACTLSSRAAMNCISGKKNAFVTLRRADDGR